MKCALLTYTACTSHSIFLEHELWALIPRAFYTAHHNAHIHHGIHHQPIRQILLNHELLITSWLNITQPFYTTHYNTNPTPTHWATQRGFRQKKNKTMSANKLALTLILQFWGYTKLTGSKLKCTLPIYVDKYFKNYVKIEFLWQEVQNISPLFHDQSWLSLSTHNRLYAQITSINTVRVGGQDPG